MISHPSDQRGRRRAGVHAHTDDDLTARLDGEIVGNLLGASKSPVTSAILAIEFEDIED